MTISVPDRFRLAAPRGRRGRIGMAIWLLEQSRLVLCRRPGRTKTTRLTRRRIAVWRLAWPRRVARARRDARGGWCADGRPRDVGPRCERWRAFERARDAAFEPPLASQVLLGIEKLEPSSQALPAADPISCGVISSPPGVGAFAIRVLRRPPFRKGVSACRAVAGRPFLGAQRVIAGSAGEIGVEMRGSEDGPIAADARCARRPGGIPRADRPLPAGAPVPLLPDPRLDAGC
jgi:hypothetical protein